LQQIDDRSQDLDGHAPEDEQVHDPGVDALDHTILQDSVLQQFLEGANPFATRRHGQGG